MYSDLQSERCTEITVHEAPGKTQYYRLRRPEIPVEKPEVLGKTNVLDYEDMPNEKLVSDGLPLQEHQQTLSELLTQVRESLTRIEALLAQNPELSTLCMVDLNPTTAVLKSVREAVSVIFNATGRFFGISTFSEPSNSFTKESARVAVTTIHPKTAQELISEDPNIQNAMTKLRALAGKIDYKNPRGRGAINPVTWIERNLIDNNLLTKEDVKILPLFAWREVSPKLSQALSDHKSSKK